MFATKRSIGGALVAAALTTIALAATAASPVAAAEPLPTTHALATALPHRTLSAPDGHNVLDACPIEGERDLHDSWGWPRSGGRRHQGIDVSAPYGTELYAVRDGVIDVKTSRLGGNAIWLTTDDGDKFYYAHLDGFSGGDRAVAAGELIGWVGSTGNAGGPHLHFEVHPDGDVTNPYPFVVDACTAPDATAALDTFLDRVALTRIAAATLTDEAPDRQAGSSAAMPV